MAFLLSEGFLTFKTLKYLKALFQPYAVPEITFHHTEEHQIQLFHCYNYLAVLPLNHQWRHSSRVYK